MVINDNNSQINSFTKGMNSDSAYDQIENTQYVFGKNIRITKNQSLGGSADYSSVHEGIVAPVLRGVSVTNGTFDFGDSNKQYKILYINTVDDLGVIIATKVDDTKTILVYRFKINPETNTITTNPALQTVWTYAGLWKGTVPDKVSAVLYKELDNVIKLYIADGEHPIITLRVDDYGVSYYNQHTGGSMNMNPDDLMNNRIMPQDRVFIDNIITGRLVTSQVQYTYRYYNKYGNSSQLAPLTNKIQVIDSSRSKETGNAENTETSIGFSLSINTSDYNNRFNRIQVFRLSYIKPGEDAEVALIYDDKIDTDVDTFILNDIGIEPLQKYTMEEFSAMQGLILIPQTIEQNQEYLFCGNVKDDTIIKNLTVQKGIYTTPIYAEVTLTNTSAGTIPNTGNNKYTSSSYFKYYSNDSNTGISVTSYLKQRGINPGNSSDGWNVADNYNNIFTSSLLRSLRREENYKYAIIFYDKYGRRSDVQPIQSGDGTIYIPGVAESRDIFEYSDSTVKARPVGLKIDIPSITGDEDFDLSTIIGCQIVRRSSSDIYQKTLLQVALARPVRQGLLELHVDDPDTITEGTVKKSPYYPTGLLNNNTVTIYPSHYNEFDVAIKSPTYAKTDNYKLFQIFSSEIDFRRDDVYSRLSYSDLNIVPLLAVGSEYTGYSNNTVLENRALYATGSLSDPVDILGNNIQIDRRLVEKLTIDKKQAQHWVFNFYNREKIARPSTSPKANSIKDVKIADWKDTYTDIIKDDNNDIRTAIKKYRSYTTNIDSYIYNNWVSFGKYDFRPGLSNEPNQESTQNEAQDMLDHHGYYESWLSNPTIPDPLTTLYWERYQLRNGYGGPGPSCFLMTSNQNINLPYTNTVQTVVCNITHTPKLSNVQSEQTEQYFGFGNYFPLVYSGGELRVKNPDGTVGENYMIVFDGDIYITPHEFTTQFKAYNFESIDTLQGTQVTNYIPLESKVNTYFDYGMNLMNTQSANLLYEPGSIDGVTTQERPLHQYNMIYSDNDASNDVFTLISTDKNETNNFKQRAYYSELKSNGEFIDNFLIFKATSFIDVDSKYGEITNMLTDKNTLYYWQDQAFGKFSVNERSLVNDQNSNTIMLGQAGILSRYDYMSTKYGMRLHDFCAKTTENGLFWVDINNKAVVGAINGQVVNYGEYTGVQNIINKNISTDVPYVDYDLQNNELLCKCFTGGDQIVFNTKYNIATAIYTRLYSVLFTVKNHLYSIYQQVVNDLFYVNKLNYITHGNNQAYLSPIQLEFVVNASASVTKVFDSQQIVPIKRGAFSLTGSHIMDNTTLSFQTDLVETQNAMSMNATKGDTNPMSPKYDITNPVKLEPYTDREGNIVYNIPRYNNQQYGSRIRGKWMKVALTKTMADASSVADKQDDLFTISHVITKFRQSFS